MEVYQFMILAVLLVAAIIVGIAGIAIIPKKNNNSEEMSRLRQEIIAANQSSVKNMGEMIASDDRR